MITPAYSATITTYSSSTSWLAATTGDQEDSLSSLAPAGSYTMYPGGFSQAGVEYIGLSGSIFVADTTSGAFSWANFGTGEAGFITGTNTIAITIPTPVTAFAINLWSSPFGQTYTVSTLSTPFSVGPTSTSAPPTFFGITSDTAFTTVDVTAQAGTTYAIFDNVQWGTTETPEAGTFLLIGTGLMGFAVFRRKMRQPR